jgi:ketosteroid isomerase-like protein
LPNRKTHPIQNYASSFSRSPKKFEDAWNNNDATALAALFTEDAVLIEESGPVYGREAIEKHYEDLFQNVHFSNNHAMYNDPNSNSPHAIGTDGNEMWENGEWSVTWQVKGSDPVQGKGYHASIAVREDGVWKKADGHHQRNSRTGEVDVNQDQCRPSALMVAQNCVEPCYSMSSLRLLPCGPL